MILDIRRSIAKDLNNSSLIHCVASISWLKASENSLNTVAVYVILISS